MCANSRTTRVSSVLALGLLAGGWGSPARAQDTKWWQRFRGYMVAGIADVRATPDSGGSITMSFDDSGTVGTDLSLVGGSGKTSRERIPIETVGLRFKHTDHLIWGVEMHRFAFGDALSGLPLNAPGSRPLPNFATQRETSTFDLNAKDIAVTAGYSRWGVTLDVLYGKRDGNFSANSEMEVFGVFTPGNFVNLSLSNGSSFRGDGKLLGYGLSYKILRTPISLFACYKRSDLSGKSDSFGRVVGSVAASPNPPLVGAATVTRNNADAEAKTRDHEYGVQIDINLPSARVHSLVRLSYLKTEWTLEGRPTGGAGFGGTIASLTTNSFSRAGLGRAELKGYVVAVGVVF